MKRSYSMPIFVAILALVQGALGIFRAFDWFNIGADLLGQGLVILPLVGVVAFALGGFIYAQEALYVLFAVGMLLQKSWAWWLGLSVAAISILLVLNVVIQGESVLRRGLLADCTDHHHCLSPVASRTRGGPAVNGKTTRFASPPAESVPQPSSSSLRPA